jgi:hypothetical protein
LRRAYLKPHPASDRGDQTGWSRDYDRTIIPLHAKPGYSGDAYYTRKSNYGLNVQVILYVLFNSEVADCHPDWKCTIQSPYR